ncbi:hypothetical protein ACFS5J_04945 [Flavobacterium chuncheonense]|uniref:Uncharacterized protein n=1 Tax=Flavobacterium chuncheonense TaxID=2026653 RepID=A0ABW5YKT3_9FLAO
MKLKTLVVLALIAMFKVSAQEKQLFAKIPVKYSNAKEFVLFNNEKDSIISFNRNHSEKEIKQGTSNYKLVNRKTLVDESGETVAFFKNKKIYFPSKDISITEKKTKNGWAYFSNEEKILEINYTFNKEAKEYDITLKIDESNEVTENLIMLSMGKFDKRVIMDYENDDDISTMMIIAIIVALA